VTPWEWEKRRHFSGWGERGVRGFAPEERKDGTLFHEKKQGGEQGKRKNKTLFPMTSRGQDEFMRLTGDKKCG